MRVKVWQVAVVVLLAQLVVTGFVSSVAVTLEIVVLVLLACTAVLRRERMNRRRLLSESGPGDGQMSLRERWRRAAITGTYGATHPQVICAQCQTRGHVRIKRMHVKQGISGGKAVGALLTGGVSMLATGLSRKGWETQAHCEACGTTWNL
jgi:uncharacterized paraquat-inducible protein A